MKKIKIKKFYTVTYLQFFFTAVLVSLITTTLLSINILIKDYITLPIVVLDKNNSCLNVINYRNGDAYVCGDVNVILRNYRKKLE